MRSMVEGYLPVRDRKDVAHHAIQIPEHVARGDADHPNAVPPEPVVPGFVPRRSVATIMALAIHLDRKPLCRAEEVEHISSGRVLPSKAKAIRSLAECLPE